jgi:hypothetical protein
LNKIMSNIIPFESGNLPAYFKEVDVSSLNTDLTNHSGGGFPIISIKGKIFTVVRDGVRTVLPNPKDPDSPATAIDVVVVKANKGTSKVFYAGGYSEGGDQKKPDCFSNTGDKPDPSVKSPQAKSCATCTHNQWGSRTGENGGKGKACQDSVRIAIAAPGMLNDPMLLRVPPASIRALGEFGQACAKRGLPYNAVVTKLGFDMESPTPKLVFRPVGMLDDKGFSQVQEVAASDTVASILGKVGSPDALPAPTAKVEAPKVEEAPAPKVEAAPKKKVEVKEIDTSDLNLDDLNFDD